MTHNRLIVLTFVLSHFYVVSALNILAIVSLPLQSHYMFFKPLFHELSLKGHKVTVMNNYPDHDPPNNLSFVNLKASKTHSMVPMSEFEKYSSDFSHLYNLYFQFLFGPEAVTLDCETFFENEDVKKFRDNDEKFDVIFVEQFISDCGLVYATTFYDAPIIGIASHTLLPWAYPRLGIPFDIASDSFYFSDAGANPSLYKKVENFLMNFYVQSIGRWQIHSQVVKVFSKHVYKFAGEVEEIARKRIVMMFSNQHHSVTGARLLSPKLLEIGGIHIQKVNTVPEDIQTFLSSAVHGAIYVSFGSNLKANTMSEHKIQQFLLAFEKIPQKVLWKVDNITLPSDNERVFTSKWFPQLDILCHPKVLAFVSHGGMLSISESAHCGKPILAIPFYGDQFSNVAAVVQSGLGMKIHFQELNSSNLIEIILKLTDSNMQESAKRVSKLWHDRPMHVMDSAIYWTEYVARHKYLPPQPSVNNTLFESTLIDVYSVILLLIITITLFIYYICKLIVNVFLKILLNLFTRKSIANKKYA